MDTQQNTSLNDRLAYVPSVHDIPDHDPQQYYHQYQATLHQPSTPANVLDCDTVFSPPPPALNSNSGYEFRPTEIQLIRQYLKNKIEKRPMPYDLIPEVFFYKENPESLAARFPKCNRKEWFFFTPTEKKYSNGSRPRRSAIGGFCKATGSDKPIKRRNIIIGHKKVLVFYEGTYQEKVKTNWILHEYRIDTPARVRRDANDMTLDDVVLCKMYNNTRHVNDDDDDDDDEEEENAESHQQQNHQGPDYLVFVNEEAVTETRNDSSLMPSTSSDAFTGEFTSLMFQSWEGYTHRLQEFAVPSSFNAAFQHNAGSHEQHNHQSGDEIALVNEGAVPETHIDYTSMPYSFHASSEENAGSQEQNNHRGGDESAFAYEGAVPQIHNDFTLMPSSSDGMERLLQEEDGAYLQELLQYC